MRGTQLISKFCKTKVPIMVLAFGLLFGLYPHIFKRRNNGTEKILESIEIAVDEIAKGKRL